jgi:hypothetical protein
MGTRALGEGAYLTEGSGALRDSNELGDDLTAAIEGTSLKWHRRHPSSAQRLGHKSRDNLSKTYTARKWVSSRLRDRHPFRAGRLSLTLDAGIPLNSAHFRKLYPVTDHPSGAEIAKIETPCSVARWALKFDAITFAGKMSCGWHFCTELQRHFRLRLRHPKEAYCPRMNNNASVWLRFLRRELGFDSCSRLTRKSRLLFPSPADSATASGNASWIPNQNGPTTTALFADQLRPKGNELQT